jgi:glycosyltransferase involved in cell wall biosynthesis
VLLNVFLSSQFFDGVEVQYFFPKGKPKRKLNRPPRVAYLSYDGLTDPLGQSQILPYILGLEELGFEFILFTFEKANVQTAEQAYVSSAIAGKNIKWIPLRYHKRPPIFSTLFDIYSLWKSVKREHDRKPFSMLHCRSYVTSLVGLYMKRRHGTKFIFDMRGFWADERVEGGLWNLRNPFYKLAYNYFKKKEKKFLSNADHVISLTENAKQEILSWKVDPGPITVIPTCVDLELFDPKSIKRDEQDGLREKLGISQDDFVLMYLGSWGTWYLTQNMLTFFTEVKKQKSNAKFLLVTHDTVNLDGYGDKANVVTTQAKRSLVPLYISLANAAVVFIKPSFSKKASSATKVGEFLAMNIPIVTNKGWGDIESFEGNEGVMLLQVDFPPEGLIDAAKKIGDFKSAFLQREKLAPSLMEGVEKYRSVYEAVIKG